jgi:hypothetical protein
MKPTGYPKTSVANNQSTMRNIAVGLRSQYVVVANDMNYNK